jgi:hypothetical protein
MILYSLFCCWLFAAGGLQLETASGRKPAAIRQSPEAFLNYF